MGYPTPRYPTVCYRLLPGLSSFLAGLTTAGAAIPVLPGCRRLALPLTGPTRRALARSPLLRRLAGAWPEGHTGVCLLPSRAHAGITVDGEPIGEPEGLRDNFKPLMTVVAGGKNRGR